jgi:glycine/sarcosine N-methyltransferase
MMYDEFSSLYDRFVNWQNRLAYEMPFIEQQLKTLNKEYENIDVLDAACGTGMHVVELSQRGYKAYGADSSKPMILKAIENAVNFDVHAEFKTIGFGELKQAFKRNGDSPNFDAILCLGNSIPHITDPQELENALADMRASLNQEGFLLIQNRNFDAVVFTHQRWMEPQSYRGKDGEWIFLRFYDFKPNGKINFNILTLHRSENPGWEQNVQSIELYPWQSTTLLESLKQAGFKHFTCFGDMEGNPFQPENSGNLIIRADVN